MLDVVTKNRINTARDILVGKVPDPKSQVEQITIALIYKFMDDMDTESEELGGKRTFFAGDFAKYAWRKIFDPRMSGYELLNLYSEAIGTMDTNPGVPKLFRDIFKNAYLPYRDPETLKSFLKIINEFDYSHSEKLGDAFEFLLSVLGSQGNAGQFRTPRHIIDLMVEIVDPKKDETILDPACGTAGFLISSYKHIIRQNSSNYNPEEHNNAASNGDQSVADRIISTNGYTGDKLSAEERKTLARNIHGYDISPDMVKLSLVNMYLHGIKDPKISEYDTLTSEDNWNYFSDVILANPPFMTPKGGIRPHKRFSVQSNRSEVLFVDYIMEHLTPNGRAAVIVPEGIIFQSGKAYKELRKRLVNDCLVGVISLPAGVFQPYSGVKTSILWLDKSLAKKTDKVLFVKIENDGFDLGAQRRAIKGSDLPLVLQKISTYINLLVNEKKTDAELVADLALVPRNDISGNEDYSLNSGSYETRPKPTSKYDFVELRYVAELQGGYAFKSEELLNEEREGCLPVIKIGNIDKNGTITLSSVQYFPYHESLNRFLIERGETLVAMTGATVGKVAVSGYSNMLLNQRVGLIRVTDKSISNRFLSRLLLTEKFYNYCQKTAGGGAQGNISPDAILRFQIPLPPLSVQEEIVEELESHQKIIDGARQVVDNYKPLIDIDPGWEVVRMDEIVHINKETINPSNVYEDWFRYLDISAVENGSGVVNFENVIKVTDAPSRARRVVKEGDVLLSTVRPNLKAYACLECLPDRVIASTGFAVLTSKPIVKPRFLFYMLFSESVQRQMESRMGKGSYPSINERDVSELLIPLPSIELQQAIVSQFKKEEEIVSLNRVLITLYEQRIKDRISKVWGE